MVWLGFLGFGRSALVNGTGEHLERKTIKPNLLLET